MILSEHHTRMRKIYFIRPVGERGPVKIGCSVNPEKRRQSLQSARGAPLEIAASIPGTMIEEQRAHCLFWHDHLGGEWFEWSPVLQLLLDAIARGEADLNALPPLRTRRMPGRRKPWTDEQKQRVRERRLNHRNAR